MVLITTREHARILEVDVGSSSRDAQEIAYAHRPEALRSAGQILRQIAARREKGQQTSQTIEAASRRISEMLHTLSEVSFVTPYIENACGEGIDLMEELERPLQECDGAGIERR